MPEQAKRRIFSKNEKTCTRKQIEQKRSTYTKALDAHCIPPGTGMIGGNASVRSAQKYLSPACQDRHNWNEGSAIKLDL